MQTENLEAPRHHLTAAYPYESLRGNAPNSTVSNPVNMDDYHLGPGGEMQTSQGSIGRLLTLPMLHDGYGRRGSRMGRATSPIMDLAPGRLQVH